MILQIVEEEDPSEGPQVLIKEAINAHTSDGPQATETSSNPFKRISVALEAEAPEPMLTLIRSPNDRVMAVLSKVSVFGCSE